MRQATHSVRSVMFQSPVRARDAAPSSESPPTARRTAEGAHRPSRAPHTPTAPAQSPPVYTQTDRHTHTRTHNTRADQDQSSPLAPRSPPRFRGEKRKSGGMEDATASKRWRGRDAVPDTVRSRLPSVGASQACTNEQATSSTEQVVIVSSDPSPATRSSTSTKDMDLDEEYSSLREDGTSDSSADNNAAASVGPAASKKRKIEQLKPSLSYTRISQEHFIIVYL